MLPPVSVDANLMQDEAAPGVVMPVPQLRFLTTSTRLVCGVVKMRSAAVPPSMVSAQLESRAKVDDAKDTPLSVPGQPV
jgi:hypothetical protein